MQKITDDWFWNFDRTMRNPVTTVDDFLSAEEMDKIVNWATDDKFKPAMLAHGKLDSNIKYSSNVYLPFNEFDELYKKLENTIIYINKNYYQYLISKLQKLELIKYTEGGHMAVHTDCSFHATCKLSCLMPLTEQNVDYEGGDFLLHDGNRPITPANGIHKLEMKKGSIVFFPSYMLHEVTKVTRGKRLTVWCGAYGDLPLV